MRLVIIVSDPSGRVSLASEHSYATGEAVAEAVAGLLAEGSLDASAPMSVVDVEGAMPVVVVRDASVPPSAAAEPEEADDVSSAPSPLAAALAAALDQAQNSDLPPSAAEVAEDTREEMSAPADMGLAEVDAAPPEEDIFLGQDVDAVAPAGEVLPAIAALDEAPALDEVLQAVQPDADVVDGIDAPEEQASPEAGDVIGQQWPWDLPVVPEEGAVDEILSDDPVERMSDEPVGIAVEDPIDILSDDPVEIAVEDLVEDLSVEAASPEEPVAADEAFVAVEGGVVSEEADQAPELVILPGGLDDDILDEALAEPLAATGTTDAVESVAVPPSVVVEPLSVLGAPDAPVETDDEASRVYEPGALNMNEYTCADCVYVNTCPNHDQKRPAECGSFQWKSV